MLPNLPNYIAIIFGLTTLITLLFFYWTIKNSRVEATRKKATLIVGILVVWIVVQAFLTLKGFYNTNTNVSPPKLLLSGIAPPLVTMLLLFITSRGREFIDSLPLKNLTYINTVRVPVELVLLALFLNKAIPELLTFEGRNFDIFSGVTAPFVAWFGFTKGKLSRTVLLAWNFVCLALLLNVVVYALLSTPFPSQQFAFDQPNIAILYFPFSWLPTFVVPLVLFGHLTSIRQLIAQTPKGALRETK